LKICADGFELLQGRFTQAALKIGIAFAREDSAAGKTIFIHSAFTIYVVGTSAGRHWLNIFGTYLCG
jgi:hypothetical protein